MHEINLCYRQRDVHWKKDLRQYKIQAFLHLSPKRVFYTASDNSEELLIQHLVSTNDSSIL